MKKVKDENTNVDPKVWCAKCDIRIAPSEDRTVADGKTYHPRCYETLHIKAKS